MLKAKKYILLVFLAMIAGCGASMPKATIYQVPLSVPDMYVDVYKPDKAYKGTTLFADNHKKDQPKIIEVDMNGRIIWEYVLPYNLRKYNNPGFDVVRVHPVALVVGRFQTVESDPYILLVKVPSVADYPVLAEAAAVISHKRYYRIIVQAVIF